MYFAPPKTKMFEGLGRSGVKNIVEKCLELEKQNGAYKNYEKEKVIEEMRHENLNQLTSNL
eukprot:CAMPEP_0116887362 /NCGR_PEP_ID=MMETSP0463-20121206/21793_1 /TAXON_ID=181622 /ORGANISM="Strombidinopsis sp, Strain SopsisLIS2011" /LENGTH=60 /DNA_ID=CAMNT_0004549869 /DNA_START=1248 /DNA_END=1430 /DNA_ORIENTATION=+